MEFPQIDTPEALDAAFAAPRFLLYKHSPRCAVSAMVVESWREALGAHPDVPGGLLDVVAHRDLAAAVAERTGVPHASPQILLLAAGRVAWTASHAAITRAALERALTAPTPGA